MYSFPLRLHVYPGRYKLLEGYLCLPQLKDAVHVLWCFKTHFGRKCCWWYCPLLWPDHVLFFFYIPQDKGPVRGEIVLSSNDLTLELQVERNQWVFLCSYHLLCFIIFVYYHYLQLSFSFTWYGRINWLGDIGHWLYYNRRYQKAATTLYTSVFGIFCLLFTTFFANTRTLCFLS